MQISFKTKQQNNAEQEAVFLALSGIERIHTFIDLILYYNDFPTMEKSAESENFVFALKVKKA